MTATPAAQALLSNLLTNSRLDAFASCKRLHKYKYLDGIRAVDEAEELAFGSLGHLGLEHWWCAVQLGAPRETWLDAALNAVRADVTLRAEFDEYLVAAVEVLLIGYDTRWGDEAAEYEVLGVEERFEMPLVNPATGAKSPWWRLGGKLDVRVRRRSDGVHGFIEHKFTKTDVSEGSFYWARLSMDSQVSIYFDGATVLGNGEAAEFCIYDVVFRPGIRPLKATPVEKREYTKQKDRACAECKKKYHAPAPHTEEVNGQLVECSEGRIVTDAGGRLYANMREFDETPQEYQARLIVELEQEPTRYFHRHPVVRLDGELEESRAEIWAKAAEMREAIRAERHPRNPKACSFGDSGNKVCPFFAACSVPNGRPDDPRLFRRTDLVHPELAGKPNTSTEGEGLTP